MLELNRIHCGDNCELLGQMPRECVDLVVTSPPYDDLRTYGGHSWDFFGVAWHLKRVLKLGGVIVWVVNDATVDGSETGSSFEQALHFRRIGLRLHDTMFWEKKNPTPQDPDCHRYTPATEYMFVFAKGKPKTCNYIREDCLTAGRRSSTTSQRRDDGTSRTDVISRRAAQETADTKVIGNVWRYPTASAGHGHPAAYPEELARDHVATWSNPGDLVLDPFSGSGTTAKAAKTLGRQFIGLEVNPEYCAIAEQRIAQEVLALA